MIAIFINTFNDSALLARALRDLFSNLSGDYRLFLDDDGSTEEEFHNISQLAAKYHASLTRAPQKKGRANPYLIVREIEIFQEIIASSPVDVILKMDPDTTIYSPIAFTLSNDTELCGFRKNIDKNNYAHMCLEQVLCKIYSNIRESNSYVQGGFYFIRPVLVKKIVNATAWQQYLQLYTEIDLEVCEDRMLTCLTQAVGGKVEFVNQGFFHGAKDRLEYYGRLWTSRHPALGPFYQGIIRARAGWRRLRGRK